MLRIAIRHPEARIGKTGSAERNPSLEQSNEETTGFGLLNPSYGIGTLQLILDI